MRDVKRIVRIIDAVFKNSGSNYSKMSEKIIRNGKPMSRQTLFKMVKRGSINLSTFLEVLDSCGFHIAVLDEDGLMVFDEKELQ